MKLLIRGKQPAHYQYAFYGFGEAIPKEVPNLGAETRVPVLVQYLPLLVIKYYIIP